MTGKATLTLININLTLLTLLGEGKVSLHEVKGENRGVFKS